MTEQLSTITLTHPITLDDMRQLYQMIKSWCPRGVADVYHTNGTRAYVTIDLDGVRIRKIYDAA